MTLLEEIQNAAVDANSDLGTLLRKCKVLAARLGSKPLEDWLLWESNGYPQSVPVPEYRIWRLEVFGHFFGPFGSSFRNMPIPVTSLSFLSDDVKQSYERYEHRDSIASVEAALRTVAGGNVHVSTGDLAIAIGTRLYQDHNCLEAWAMFGSSNLVELLNSVRNRILDFALAVWKEAPNAGEFGNTSSMNLEARVTQIFNTTVYGGSANLVGTASQSTITVNIGAGDFAALERVLREQRVSGEDIRQLKIALDSDDRPADSKRFGPRVSSWVAMMMKKAADGSWNVGIGAAGSLLAAAIGKYYGF